MTSFAETVQRYIGPPVNIEAIIRSLGIKLDKKAELDSEISGQLERLSDGSFKISVNKDDTYYRQRFTMAHELGHYLLHAHLIGNGVDDNRAYRSVPAGNYFNQAITPREETQANQFASRLLLPNSVMRSHAKVGMSVKDLSRELQASLPATEIRLSSLGYGVINDRIVSVPAPIKV